MNTIRTAVKLKVEAIAEEIYRKIQKQQKEKTLGLYDGDFGVLLFILYYAKYSKDQRFISTAEVYAEDLISQLTKINSPTFCTGLSGILYLFEFLREKEFIDIDVNECQDKLHNYLTYQMQKYIQNKQYDFMHGAIGIGLYFLKKQTNEQQVQDIINFLYVTAEKDDVKNTLKWKSIINYDTNYIGYNIALSHGISSIAIFISRILKSNIKNEHATKLLQGSINYILSQRIDPHKYGSFFPSHSLDNLTDISQQGSRLAWCYGDLGIAIALWRAGKNSETTQWQNIASKIAEDSTNRLYKPKNRVIDAGICHGSAGIAMLFNRMFLETRESKFKEATIYWLKQTLYFARFEDGLAGFKTFQKDWVIDYSLLTGISGIGLVLTSYLMNDSQDWDELFLLT